MPPVTLRSYEFRREREERWDQLESLLQAANRNGLRSLPPEDLFRLPALYRMAISSLAVARAISLDRNLVSYLESLAARAYVYVYGAKVGFWSSTVAFFRRHLPSAVRELRGELLLAILLLLAGTTAGHLITARDIDRFYALVPEALAQERTPTSSRAELLEVLRGTGSSSELAAFSAMLLAHNSRVGILAFALGVAAGVPVVLLLFSNGLMLGAFSALHQRQDLSFEFWGWILPHGVTELLAVALCGAAGLRLGRTVLFPTEHRKLDALAREGRRAASVVIGAISLFFLAALLEAFFRQWVTIDIVRYLVAVVSLWIWYRYFWPR